MHLHDQFGHGPHEPHLLPEDICGLADDPYRVFLARRQGAVPEVVRHEVTGLIGETDEDLAALCERIDGISREALERAQLLADLYKPKVVIEHPAAQYRLAREFIPGEPLATSAHQQVAAAEALNGPQDAVDEMVEEFRARRDLIVEGLNSIPGVNCLKPHGAFYVFPDMSGTGMSGPEL
ncbi:aminotransferase class I/II-fold pyridoxal phosphate-dependent enzyme, partial [Lacticaseibacillus rhamnosus]